MIDFLEDGVLTSVLWVVIFIATYYTEFLAEGGKVG